MSDGNCSGTKRAHKIAAIISLPLIKHLCALWSTLALKEITMLQMREWISIRDVMKCDCCCCWIRIFWISATHRHYGHFFGWYCSICCCLPIHCIQYTMRHDCISLSLSLSFLLSHTTVLARVGDFISQTRSNFSFFVLCHATLPPLLPDHACLFDSHFGSWFFFLSSLLSLLLLCCVFAQFVSLMLKPFPVLASFHRSYGTFYFERVHSLPLSLALHLFLVGSLYCLIQKPREARSEIGRRVEVCVCVWHEWAWDVAIYV